jgi:hypothetical protein
MKKVTMSVVALTIAMMSYGQSTQCNGLTKDSVGCKNTTKTEVKLCYLHNPNYEKVVVNTTVVWKCEVTDSYGITHVNYFETELLASKWVYYIWENEDNKVDKDDLMSNAIAECVQMDIDRGVEPSLD